jgi:hypothetical protein
LLISSQILSKFKKDSKKAHTNNKQLSPLRSVGYKRALDFRTKLVFESATKLRKIDESTDIKIKK